MDLKLRQESDYDKKTENWKSVPGHPGYEVSDLGNVRSIDRILPTKKGSRTYKGYWLRPGRMNRFGHVSVAIGHGNSMCVHALVALAFIGPNPKKLDVRHRDGNGGNNVLTNLSYGTRGQNEEDKLFHGRNRPVASGYRFTPEDINYIRSISGYGTGASLAREFGCSQTTIDYMRSRKTYKQL